MTDENKKLAYAISSLTWEEFWEAIITARNNNDKRTVSEIVIEAQTKSKFEQSKTR